MKLPVALAALLAFVAVSAVAQNKPLNTPPAGFTAIFDGNDLTGWRGIKGDYSPHIQASLPPADLAAMQTTWNELRDQHWRVDTEKHEIVSDGQSVFLGTAKDYADFELYVDWLMVNHNGDSGIYLRGYPQVQIWDVDNPREVKNGAPKGSGALWNDNPDNPGKWPLVKADNPVGSWNTFHIKMVGTRVWVWFNDQLTVDGAVLDNYFDRTIPVLPKGPVELQTHGAEIRFRNIYIREIGADEAKATLAKVKQ
jgi:hypothetical protein